MFSLLKRVSIIPAVVWSQKAHRKAEITTIRLAIENHFRYAKQRYERNRNGNGNEEDNDIHDVVQAFVDDDDDVDDE